MADPHFQFQVNPSSGVPLYRQIEDQVRALIAGGRLAPNSLLPSVRRVAEALAINPMTVSKAYSRLEAQNVIERVRGQGMRVIAPKHASQKSGTPAKQAQLDELIEAISLRGRQLGLTDAQITTAVRHHLKRNPS